MVIWVIWGLGSALLVLLGAGLHLLMRCGAAAVAVPVLKPASQVPHDGNAVLALARRDGCAELDSCGCLRQAGG
jgi:hypothetical protein